MAVKRETLKHRFFRFFTPNRCDERGPWKVKHALSRSYGQCMCRTYKGDHKDVPQGLCTPSGKVSPSGCKPRTYKYDLKSGSCTCTTFGGKVRNLKATSDPCHGARERAKSQKFLEDWRKGK